MYRFTRITLGISLLAAVTSVSVAGKPDPAQRNFVSCPILRDTKTVPCWLAEYQGELYYLGIQIDAASEFDPPHLGHKTLVEGRISDEPRICGGIVLKPLKTSILPELDQNCNTMLPAEDRYQVPFAPRGPGPNNAVRLGGPRPAPPAPPQAPFAAREFTVYYDFDTEFASHGTRVLGEALRYSTLASAKSVQVKSYRGTTRLTDGSNFVEAPWMAERRAKLLGKTLAEIGIPAETISVEWQDKPLPGGSADDWMTRRSTVLVKP